MIKYNLKFDPQLGYPAGQDVWYECQICGESVRSMPVNAAACRCGNVIVDADAGRVSVKNMQQIKAYRLVSDA